MTRGAGLLVWSGCILQFACCPLHSAEPEIPWSGAGRYRLVIEVAADAGATKRQGSDQRPAGVEVDFVERLKQRGIRRLPNVASIQVIRHDRRTGKPVADADYAYGRGKFDRPFRWYDAAIPYEFPEFADAVSRTKGRIVRRNKLRGGYFFNAIGDWRRGRLAWVHSSKPGETAAYAVYFDLLEAGAQPDRIPPRAWIGDGMPRCDLQGSTTVGADHSRVDLDDWDGDGLVDLVVGEHYGHVFWWPNVGTKQRPEFRFSRFVVNAEGQPLDAGLAAAPKVVDWDGDGRRDLLLGAHWNRLLYYRNVGDNRERRFEYQGPVLLDGQPLEAPIAPLARGDSQVFKRDYYPVPETADWDGDGDLDLLLGGYVTGRVFLYESTGRREDGTPRLKPRGPLTADGQPLNVRHWCAAPCAADFNGDGRLDLISGNMPMHVQPDERQQFEGTFLQYFEHASGELVRTEFPRDGKFPRQRLATPRAFDWDADGDLDLVVSARENIYLFENTGSRTSPRFSVHDRPIRVPWGLARLPVDHFRDWNGDGAPDLVNGYSVKLNDRAGNPYRWTRSESVLPPGATIAHWSRIGDDWFWPLLDDFDRDGRVDVLFGDWWGHVWFHQNRSNDGEKRFDLKGVRLKLASGERIKVGPVGKDPKRDFDALQGARTVLTVGDFDRDGLRDLVIGDTYGKIRWFRCHREPKDGRGEFRFDEPVEIADLKIRGLVDATDWNGDGWLDVVASAANGRVAVLLNRGAEPGGRFAPGFDPQLPPIVQPRVLMVDLNGDGDEDLFLPSTQGSCFIERSFLDGGYAAGKVIAVETRPPERD